MPSNMYPDGHSRHPTAILGRVGVRETRTANGRRLLARPPVVSQALIGYPELSGVPVTQPLKALTDRKQPHILSFVLLHFSSLMS